MLYEMFMLLKKKFKAFFTDRNFFNDHMGTVFSSFHQNLWQYSQYSYWDQEHNLEKNRSDLELLFQIPGFKSIMCTIIKEF